MSLTHFSAVLRWSRVQAQKMHFTETDLRPVPYRQNFDVGVHLNNKFSILQSHPWFITYI